MKTSRFVFLASSCFSFSISAPRLRPIIIPGPRGPDRHTQFITRAGRLQLSSPRRPSGCVRRDSFNSRSSLEELARNRCLANQRERQVLVMPRRNPYGLYFLSHVRYLFLPCYRAGLIGCHSSPQYVRYAGLIAVSPSHRSRTDALLAWSLRSRKPRSHVPDSSTSTSLDLNSAALAIAECEHLLDCRARNPFVGRTAVRSPLHSPCDAPNEIDHQTRFLGRDTLTYLASALAAVISVPRPLLEA